MVEIYRKKTPETDSEIYRYYEKIASQYGIPLIPPIEDYLRRINAGLSQRPTQINFLGENTRILPIAQRQALPLDIRTSPDEKTRLAGLYFLELIKPSLASGKDAYRPTPEDIVKFCQQLKDGQLNFVMYYAFSKTQSPIRTGSPDQIIDFAEIEMLKHWATIIGVGQRLGFNPRLVIVDETFELPEDDILGFRFQHQQYNLAIATSYLKKFLPEGSVIFRPLSESVRNPLGERFDIFYREESERVRNNLIGQLEQDEFTSDTKRMCIFLECMTPKTWDEYNIQILLSAIQTPRDLQQTLPQQLLDYLVDITTHFRTIMNLREIAKNVVIQTRLEGYPEYQSTNRVYGGITRSSSRWSFLPHPKKYNGQTRNPMHGLAVYDSRKTFQGIASFSQAINDPNSRVIYDEKGKPLFVLQI